MQILKFYLASKEIFLTLSLLVIIGLLVHHQSFNLSVYGDDWIDVFQYHTHIDPYARFSSLPGLLAYIAPYGFSIFLIGNLFRLFGTDYSFYYILSFVFRLFTVVGFYLASLEVCKLVGQSKINIKILSLLSASLVLVGYTGIQMTDWTHYMNIYLATALYFFSLFFQFKSYREANPVDMLISLGLLFSSLIVGSLRLYPVIVITPIIDILMYLLNKNQDNSKRFLIRLITFLSGVILLWAIGLFGSSFSFYRYGDWSTSKFIGAVLENPILSVRSLFYSVGTLLIPDRVLPNQAVNISIGLTGLLTFIYLGLKLLKSKKTYLWITVFGASFWLFSISIWYFGPTSLMSSEHRYLFVPFVLLIFWLNLIFVYVAQKIKKMQYLFFTIMVCLIFLHLFSARIFYDHLLDKGRDVTFAREIEVKIIQDLPDSPATAPYVYFNVDDGEVKQSLLFGLAFKTLAVKQIWNHRLLFRQYDDINAFKKDLEKRVFQGESKEQVLKSVYGYQVRNKKITNITNQTRRRVFEE